jgi:hypothetical protein
MYKLTLTLLVLFTTQLVLAQESQSDTIIVGGMTIIKKKDTTENSKPQVKIKWKEDEDSDDEKSTSTKKKKNITTNWWVLDLGLSQFTDRTDYASAAIQNPTTGIAPGATKDWMKLRSGKSINVNLWMFMRKVNLINHVVNLKYGFGLEMNNYRFSNPVIFQTNPTKLTYVPSSVNSFSKNKLAADYLTVPLMLNLNLSPNDKRGIALSAGLSAGYLINSRQKTKSSANGKQKVHDSFDLEPWKISYVGELKLGGIRLYGSLAKNNLLSKGFDLLPYNVGFRFSN